MVRSLRERSVCPSVVDLSSSDFPHFALPRYPSGKTAGQGSGWGEKP
ncbi:MAG TPA: hypothetical protein VGX76_05255 [Pirellulales bacterium]|nr:hypothetical protein [Pirellulales bacterium]